MLTLDDETGTFWVKLEEMLDFDIFSGVAEQWCQRHGVPRTVGDLVLLVQHVHPAQHRQQILSKIVAHCAEVLGVPTDSISEQTHFINDLGLD